MKDMLHMPQDVYIYVCHMSHGLRGVASVGHKPVSAEHRLNTHAHRQAPTHCMKFIAWLTHQSLHTYDIVLLDNPQHFTHVDNAIYRISYVWLSIGDMSPVCRPVNT